MAQVTLGSFLGVEIEPKTIEAELKTGFMSAKRKSRTENLSPEKYTMQVGDKKFVLVVTAKTGSRRERYATTSVGHILFMTSWGERSTQEVERAFFNYLLGRKISYRKKKDNNGAYGYEYIISQNDHVLLIHKIPPKHISPRTIMVEKLENPDKKVLRDLGEAVFFLFGSKRRELLKKLTVLYFSNKYLSYDIISNKWTEKTSSEGYILVSEL